MIDFFEKTKGSISLFLALIMLPMMTVAGLIVDGARISAAKASLSGAGDLAMNAALSEYDQILYDVYGIFAVSENMEELQNNVSRYFANSIDNTGILNDSDSYTREFINSIFSSFSGDEMEFNNIVDLKADRFTLQGVESSAIGNPKVLERQIVDYMKYRGPINIGKGLLTKLGCIGETSKQTKAIEAKVNYDQKLDTVQDACKEAYKAINEYNDLIGGNSKFASNEYLNQLSQDIDSAKKDVADMVKYLVAYNSSELNVPPLINERPSSLDSLRVIILKDQWAIFKVDSATRKEVESYYKKSKAANRELDTMAYIEGKLAERGIKVVPVENGDYGIDFGINYDEKMLKLEITQSTDLGKEIGYVKIYKELPNVKSSFTYALMYGMYAEKLPDEMKVPDKKTEAYTELTMFLGEGGSWAELWGENATEKGRSAASKLYAWDKAGEKDAYLALIQTYKDNDSRFSVEEANQLTKYIKSNKAALQADPANYTEICFETGKLYWYYYDYGDGTDNQVTRAKSAVEWFQDVLDNAPEGYANLNMARVYVNIGSFYRDITTDITEASDKGKYKPFFDNIRELLDTVAADENESEIVRLELLELSRSALQQYATKFKGDGISQADMMQMYDQVERTVTGISATADTTEHKKEATVSLLADTKKAIETAYATKGGKQA